MPHTHDDVGWGKTVEEYYTGAEAWNSHASVNLILNSVVSELLKNPKRRFTYVEIKFFSMWYNEKSQSEKE